MYHQTATPFNDMQKAIALALHDAGQTDREIADGCSTSVNNIIWWRKEIGLTEHLSPEAAARAEEERYTPPLSRAAAPKPQQAATVSISPRNDGLISPATARAVFHAPVQPEGDNALEIGNFLDAKVYVDLQSLLETRLLIQGNSGSGKSHLLRRLLEECTGIVQQVIIDPEGDFVGFSNTFGHTVVAAIEHDAARLTGIAALVRQHRGSVVLNLDGLDFEGQMSAAAAFLAGLFNVPAEHWHPAIVAVDEAHLFAPAGDNGESKEVRKASQTAMANLMCRGRKRGLAGVIATQRLSKLHKSVAAEASNVLIGRTFLDIDIARAADALGIQRSQADEVSDLQRGQFLGVGPAIARRPIKVTVGSTMTTGKAVAEAGLTPLPSVKPEDMAALLFAEADGEPEATA